MKSAYNHGRFDYLKLKQFLERLIGDEFVEAYYLNAVTDDANKAQDSFHTWLKSAPPRGPKLRVQLYGLKHLTTTCQECGHVIERPVQKGVDVGIATLALKLAMQDKYDRFVLAAGDGDFEDAIRYIVDEQAKEFVLVGFGPSLSTDLQSYARQVVFLEDHLGRDPKNVLIGTILRPS